MPPHAWRCPVPGCTAGPDGAPWLIAETASDVAALVDGYARTHHGELPEPVILGPLRAERVTVALTEHLQEHPDGELTTWIAAF